MLIFGVFFCATILNNIAPQTMAGVYGTLGLNKAQAYCYKKVYYKSERIEDLYNAIEVCVRAENYGDVASLGQTMQEKPNYLVFCDKINQRNTKNIEPKLYVYVCDYDAYLSGQIILSTYKQGKKSQAEVAALNALSENANIYSGELATLVGAVKEDDGLTNTQKQTTLATIYAKTIGGKTIAELIEDKLNSLPDPSTATNLTKLKIYHTTQKMLTAKYHLEEASGANEATLEAILNDIETAQNAYSTTLNAIA